MSCSRNRIIIIIVIIIFLISTSTTTPAKPLQSDITVSGMITGPSGPVSNVWVGVGSVQDFQSTTTNNQGKYSITLQVDSWLEIQVHPAISTRLNQITYWMDRINGDVTKDFNLVTGHLLSLRVIGSDSETITTNGWLELQGLEPLPNNYWYDLNWNDSAKLYESVVAPGIYYVTAHDPPSGYYQTTEVVDLRTSDQSVDLALSKVFINPIPYDPPDASKITIGAVDSLGEAPVTGAPGSALPLAHVFLVNLNSSHQADTISDSDGSFSTKIFAPPGSSIMVKHGPASHRWHALDVGVSEGVNPFPGTIINVAHTHSGDQSRLPFAAAGGIDLSTDDPDDTFNYVGAGWAITGTIGPVTVDGEWTHVIDGKYAGEDIPGLYLGGLNWTHPTLGDLNGDNKLDLLVGERSGQLVYYINGGTTTSPDWQFTQISYAGVNTGEWAYPALADVTGDSLLDLFVGTGNGQVLIYYNTGTQSAPNWADTPDTTLAAGEGASPALNDLDGDGDLDLLVGNESGSLYTFKNTGTNSSPSWSLQTTAYKDINHGESIQPAFINLDGDFDLDLLVGIGGQIRWYKRGGTETAPTWTYQDEDPIGFGGGSSAVSPSVGDWDGDNDDDVVTGEHWGNLRYFEQGASSWNEVNCYYPFDLGGDSAPALADWDDDGDLDMLIGQAHGSVYHFTNQEDASTPDWQSDGNLLNLPWTNHPHAFPTFADIDNDNDYDLIIGEGGWQSETGSGGNLHYYRNDGDKDTPSWTSVTSSFLGIDVGGWSAPVFVDIDNDNDLDLFIGDEGGTLTFFERTNPAGNPEDSNSWSQPLQPYSGLDLGSHSAPAFHDIDQDGDLDMLVGLESGTLAYVRNTGSKTEPDWELVSTVYPGIDIGEYATPVTVDLNGDGIDDLLIGDVDGGLNLYLYQGKGTPPGDVSTFNPNDLFQVKATMRIYSPEIDNSTDISAISANGWVQLRKLFNSDGSPLAGSNYFMSTILTPSGFPIQQPGFASIDIDTYLLVGNFQYIGGNAIEADLKFSGQIPPELLHGIYRPTIVFDFHNVPSSKTWIAANVTRYTYGENEAPMPPLSIGTVAQPRLIWRLMMDDFVQGTRGTNAREDEGLFAFASQIVTQDAPFYISPIDGHSGQPITYRLEPFLPMVSFTDRRMPTPPLIPFGFPGGELTVQVTKPDGKVLDLSSTQFVQSFNRTKTTRGGNDLNGGTVQIEDIYSLTTNNDKFRMTFDQFGHYIISMSGSVDDAWGNTYAGGGTYDLWVAHPLDIDPGVLPGTPFALGDAFNPAVQFYPRVPAQVELTLTQYPGSDPSQVKVSTITGQANQYGYFSYDGAPPTFDKPGEYRVDLNVIYTDKDGDMYMGSLTWGGVIMTPPGEANLVAHGRRGLDSLEYIPNHWFINSDLDIPEGAISHSLNPYFNGDIYWSRMSDDAYGGDSLVLGASVQDTSGGAIENTVKARAYDSWTETYPPGDLDERFKKGEIPLFINTRSGEPAQLHVGRIDENPPDEIDQIAYSYRSSQRPGVRVREVIAEDGQSGGYWRLDTLYDDQLGVGVLGDQPNDIKFQYVGAVFRDLDSDVNEYLGQGSGWIFIPDEDQVGSRVMPPFAGYGGWTAEGGPILTLKGEDIHIFILPTGVHPGAVLEEGDSFHFAGHLMPTLDSQVKATVTSPTGKEYKIRGQANSVGYFYDPYDDFAVDETGIWTVDVQVWHDGTCSGGQVSCDPNDPFDENNPCPYGDVLGSQSGRYWFYVVPNDTQYLHVGSPSPGYLSFEDNRIDPITFQGTVPPTLTEVSVDYTISMPGYILEHDEVTPSGGVYQITYDPVSLQKDFPNLDLIGRDSWQTGLSDTISIDILMKGKHANEWVYRANTITIQGEQVFYGDAPPEAAPGIYLPLVQR